MTRWLYPCWPGGDHVPLRESDGVTVCQRCGEVAA